jgi:uroporphyrin-III C-methyltransferase / precorrin-2 dehydrogenase / sirohydrochlorin ferrochelatase
MSASSVGFVSLVGGGPGDPELWTVRALKRVQEADLVLYDALIDADALRRLTAAPCFCVGKRAGRASVRQDTIHRLMIGAAKKGKRVVRLKGGDPFVFGRGAEEALALTEAGVAFEVVPGVTTAVAAPGLAGIPVTHRGVSTGFLVVAGHTGEPLRRALGGVRPGSVTLVVMMGVAGRAAIADTLVASGWDAALPAAIVCAASTPDEWIWTGTLAGVGAAPAPGDVPGVLVIGEVVSLRDALGVAESRPAEAGLYSEAKYGRS